MTLEEFRRNWIRDRSPTGDAPPAATAGRLTFVPPEEFVLVPRMVFREVFTPPPTGRRSRFRLRLWAARTLWTLVAIAATAATGVGMSKSFDYAPTYIETYIKTLN